MFTYMSEKIVPCFAIASDSPFPSVTSCRNCRLTSPGIPFDCKCDMLCNAEVSGIPAFNKFANCCVNVANSCNFGFRFRAKKLRNPGGIATAPVAGNFFAPPPAPAPAAPGADAAGPPALRGASMATGNSPRRSICASAAARSATSNTPCTTSPERRRAL